MPWGARGSHHWATLALSLDGLVVYAAVAVAWFGKWQGAAEIDAAVVGPYNSGVVLASVMACLVLGVQ